MKTVLCILLLSILAACGGGGEPLNGSDDNDCYGKKTTKPVDCSIPGNCT